MMPEDFRLIRDLYANETLRYVLFYTLMSFIIIVCTFIAVAAITLYERQGLATVQRRSGPSVVGVAGLLQPLADGLKLFTKQLILVSLSDPHLQYLAPLISLFMALVLWIVGPDCLDVGHTDYSLAIVMVVMLLSTHVYSVLLAGWSSNSKYAFLGALRSVSQMVSYEISLGFCICNVALLSGGTYRITDIVYAQEGCWYVLPLLPVFGLYLVIMLAETNRHPFDLPEADPELVAGHMTEYSGFRFAMFFLGEYVNIFFMSMMGVVMFFGGNLPPFFGEFDWLIAHGFWFSIKIIIFATIFIKARAALPRYRYDQLMQVGWTHCVPLSMGLYVVTLYMMAIFDMIL